MSKLRIAFYGIGGVGKTTLCNYIVNKEENYQFYDGSTFIEKNIDGGIEVFKKLKPEEKYKQRVNTVKEFGEIQKINGKKLLASGHFSFIKNSGYEIVWTHEDASFYTHIFYIDLPPEVIYLQQKNDSTRQRQFTLEQIKKWAEFEKNGLKNICERNGIELNIIDSLDLDGKYQQFNNALRKEAQYDSK